MQFQLGVPVASLRMVGLDPWDSGLLARVFLGGSSHLTELPLPIPGMSSAIEVASPVEGLAWGGGFPPGDLALLPCLLNETGVVEGQAQASV